MFTLGRIEEINSRIQQLRAEIQEYKDAISELEKAKEYISHRKNTIEASFYNPVRTYDMTRGGKWIGTLESEGEDMRHDICSLTSTAQGETAQLLSDIGVVIEKLRRLITDCEAEISSLMAELSVLTAASQ